MSLSSVLFIHKYVSRRTFVVMDDHTLFQACKSPEDIRPHVKRDISLVIAYGQIIFLKDFVIR